MREALKHASVEIFSPAATGADCSKCSIYAPMASNTPAHARVCKRSHGNSMCAFPLRTKPWVLMMVSIARWRWTCGNTASTAHCRCTASQTSTAALPRQRRSTYAAFGRNARLPAYSLSPRLIRRCLPMTGDPLRRDKPGSCKAGGQTRSSSIGNSLADSGPPGDALSAQARGAAAAGRGDLRHRPAGVRCAAHRVRARGGCGASSARLCAAQPAVAARVPDRLPGRPGAPRQAGVTRMASLPMMRAMQRDRLHAATASSDSAPAAPPCTLYCHGQWLEHPWDT